MGYECVVSSLRFGPALSVIILTDSLEISAFLNVVENALPCECMVAVHGSTRAAAAGPRVSAAIETGTAAWMLEQPIAR